MICVLLNVQPPQQNEAKIAKKNLIFVLKRNKSFRHENKFWKPEIKIDIYCTVRPQDEIFIKKDDHSSSSRLTQIFLTGLRSKLVMYSGP